MYTRIIDATTPANNQARLAQPAAAPNRSMQQKSRARALRGDRARLSGFNAEYRGSRSTARFPLSGGVGQALRPGHGPVSARRVVRGRNAAGTPPYVSSCRARPDQRRLQRTSPEFRPEPKTPPPAFRGRRAVRLGLQGGGNVSALSCPASRPCLRASSRTPAHPRSPASSSLSCPAPQRYRPVSSLRSGSCRPSEGALRRRRGA